MQRRLLSKTLERIHIHHLTSFNGKYASSPLLTHQRRTNRPPSLTYCSASLGTAAPEVSTSTTAATASGRLQGSTTTVPQRPKANQFHLASIAEQCREIRQKVCKEMDAGGYLYLESGALTMRNNDVYYKFRPDSNFFYVTGVSEPDFACLVDCETGHFTLLAPEIDEQTAYWMGSLPSLDELAASHGADRCCYTSDLKTLLGALGGKTVHTTPAFSSKLSGMMAGGDVRVLDNILESVLARCRAVKTDAEVACILQANCISGQAHMETWRHCKPGMHEYQLEAVFSHSCMMAGAQHLGYLSIVGAGTNAAILHYEKNRCQVQPGELVLVDAGAEFRHYSADITRTFPASGRFSTVQREVYNAVLDVQERALSCIRAGAQLAEVDCTSREVLLQRLSDMGLLRGPLDALLHNKLDRVFMPHGLSHHLGLDVHDVSATGSVPKQLLAGHVITCEPGIYFINSVIQKAAANEKQAPHMVLDRINKLQGFGGVRIEDNVLVQEGGLFNLTDKAGVPKIVSDVEAAMCA